MTPRLLQQWLTRQAERQPDKRAVIMGDEGWTYQRLESVSNRLARALRERGCRRGDRVVLLAPKSPEAVASMLGVYKADAIVVPLDASSPSARLRKILRSCQSRHLLAAGPVAKSLDELMSSDPAACEMHVGWMSGNAPSPEADPRRTFVIEDLKSYPDDPPDYANDSGAPPLHDPDPLEIGEKASPKRERKNRSPNGQGAVRSR